MAKFEFEQGDIVLAPFRFSETESAKLRPALVWATTPISVELVFIGSQKTACTPLPQEVGLPPEDAQAIGLLKCSRLDFSKRDKCLRVDVVKKIGELANLRRAKLRECFLAAQAAGLL